MHGGSPSGCRPASRPAPAHCFPGLASAGACHRHTYSILPAARAGSQCQRLRHPAGLPAHAMSCPHVHSVSEALLSLLPALFDSPPAPCSDSAAGHHWPAPDTAMQGIQEIPRHTGEAYLFRCVRVTLQSLLTVPTLPCKCCALARDDSLHPMACSPYQCDHDAWVRDANGGVRYVHRHKPELSNMYDLDWFLQPTLADGNCLPHTLAAAGNQGLAGGAKVSHPLATLLRPIPTLLRQIPTLLRQIPTLLRQIPTCLRCDSHKIPWHRSRAPLRQVTAWGLQQATKSSRAMPRFVGHQHRPQE